MTVQLVAARPGAALPPPEDWPEIKQRVVDYLEQGQLVLLARGMGDDEVDRSRRRTVPLTWRTDGNFAWPGALAYYAKEHDRAPAAALLDHLRARDFMLREASDEALAGALLALRGGQ